MSLQPVPVRGSGVIVVLLLAVGCGGGPSGGLPDMGMPALYPVAPPETQRAGDPQKGYAALVNNGYVSCGVPYALYKQFFTGAPENERLPGRTGKNVDITYWQTAFTTQSGVEVVSANCLTCHAGWINGKLIVGLGDSARDYTQNQGVLSQACGFVTDEKQKAECVKWGERLQAIGPYIRMETVGVNPADNLAAALFAHRDPKTLAWSKEPLIELPPTQVVPVDVPPWWRMKKKNAMFYSAAGRGDHARIMMTASTLCTDSVEEAKAIDAYFNDVRAYIASIEPPKWPHAIDEALAAKGKDVFAQNCARCHGTYGAGGSYPNYIVPNSDIGTDTALSVGASQFAERFTKWFNSSFYGQAARLEPQPGYVAPPLDGIWATAPYLHNGSVPTLAALLDSKTRPKYWTRNFENSSDYDTAAVGWRFTVVDHGQADEPDMVKKRRIYDTTLFGYGNGGHTFGDALSGENRAAVIEYLKTL